MKKAIYLIIAIALFSAEMMAQVFNPTNTNFESLLIQQDSIPMAWNMSNKSKSRGFDYKLSTDARSGKHSMMLFSTKENLTADDYASVDQELSPDAYLGRKIEFSAYCKADFPYGDGYSMLWVKVYYADHTVRDFVCDEYVRQSGEWKQYKVTADIGFDAKRISYGFQMTGEGKLWVDDVSFAPVSNASYSSLSLSNLQKKDLLDYAKFASKFLFYYPDARLAASDLRSVCEIGVNSVLTGKGKLSDNIKYAFPFADKLQIGKAKKNTLNTIDTKTLSATVYPGFRMYHGFYSLKQQSRFSGRFQNYYANFRENPGQIVHRIGLLNIVAKDYTFQVFMKYLVVGEHSRAYAALTFRDEDNQIIKIHLPELKKGKSKNDWLELIKKGKVPEGAASAEITLFLDGEGTAVFDDASLIIAGEEMVKNGGFEEFTVHWAVEEKGEAKGYKILKNVSEKRNGYASLEIKIDDNNIAQYPKLSDYTEIKLSDETMGFPNVAMRDTRDSAAILPDGYYQDFNNPIARISAVIYTWAFLDNFSTIKVDNYAKQLDNILLSEMENAAKARTRDELIRSLKRVSTLFPDNALRFWSDEQLSMNLSSLPILLKFIDNDLCVYNSISSQIPKGSKVNKINGEAISDILAREMQYVPASSDGFAKSIIAANLSYSYSDKNDTFNIEVNGKNRDFILSRSYDNMRRFSYDMPADTMLSSGIYYIDLTRHSEQSISQLFKEINKSIKGVIFDLRGYTTISEYFFKYFKRGKFKDVDWAFPYFFKYGEISPAKRKYSPKITGLGSLKDAKIIALCDERTIGLAEYHLHLLRNNAMAKTIGTASSGAPSEPAVLPLPCEISMSFSAIQSYDSMGKTLLGKQFIPDIIVKKTIRDIVNGQDPLILRGLQVLQDEISK